MKLKEIHRNQAILPLQRESRVPGPQRAGGRQRVILAFRCRMTIKFCIESRVLVKLEEILRKLAILPLHSESGALGPQRAGARQMVKTDIVGVGLRLNLYKLSSFDVI